MNRITSKQNKLLVATRKVRDRKDPGLFFVEGKRLFEELVSSKMVIEDIFVSEDVQTEYRRLDQESAPIHICDARAFRSICETKNPQGIAATVRRPAETRPEELLDRHPDSVFSLLLENVSNPGNLGAVVRSAEAAGADFVMLTGNHCDAYMPAAVRGSMGSIFRLPVASGLDVEQVLKSFRERDVRVYGASGTAQNSLSEVKWSARSLVCIGNEAHGLSESAFESVDELFKIPMKPPVESLNLAVAASVVLYSKAMGSSPNP